MTVSVGVAANAPPTQSGEQSALPELRALYNDAAIGLLGARHPHGLGMPIAELAPEMWPDLAAAFARAQAGISAFAEDLRRLTA